MPKGLLIHNPKAGSLDAELLPKLVSALGEVVSVSIEELGEAGNALRYAKGNRCDWIAVAGGDGTVESVASSLVGTTLPLGIIPAAHSITLPEASTCLWIPSKPAELSLRATPNRLMWALRTGGHFSNVLVSA